MNLLVLVRIVNDHSGDRFAEDISDSSEQKSLVAVDACGSSLTLGDLGDLFPNVDEVKDIRSEFNFGAALALRAHDQTKPFRADLFANLFESLTLAAVFDLSADADASGLGHQDNGTTRKADTGAHSGAFGPSRSLGDLNHDLLTWLEKVLDLSPTEFGASHSGRAIVASLFGKDVSDAEVSVALESDVNKRGVHSWKNVLDNAFEDRANNTLFALDSELHELSVLEEGNAGFSVCNVDDQLATAYCAGGRGGRN
jgi:hypothetical protein